MATSHTLTIQCIDSYNLTDVTTVFVTVSPVNEHTPSFRQTAVPIFNITSGNIDNVFLITSDGRIIVNGILDRESLSFYYLQIQIKDRPRKPK